LLRWQDRGLVFSEEGAAELVRQSRTIVGSHDHARFEAQRCIGEGLYDHPVSMKAWRQIYKKWACISMFRSEDPGTASDRGLRGVKQRVFSVGGAGGTEDIGTPPVVNKVYRADWQTREFLRHSIHALRPPRRNPFEPLALRAYFRSGSWG
jgi:hypothetical protein